MLIAIAVAVLPPQAISRRAIELSAGLPRREPRGLLLSGEVLPHITLTQHFLPADQIDEIFGLVGSELAGLEPLHLTVTGASRGRSSVWMAVEPTPVLSQIHRRLMDLLHDFERAGGTQAAFVDGDARPDDVEWVAGFRRNASYEAFTPHITLGHSATLPSVEPMSFDAATIAACHLGRFCTCRRILRQWKL